ncbi:MAG: hypothetical protein U1F26_02170 [Lysobacterales bacterium]
MRRLWALALCLPALAWADYKSAYREGVAAAERSDWKRAETLMREALAGEATPNERMRLYGMVYTPYIPQFYLGQALFNQNDCKGTLQWLNAPEASAIVAGLPRQSQARQMMIDRCTRRLALDAATPSTPAATPPSSTAATPPASSIKPPTSTPPPAPPVQAQPLDPARVRAVQAELAAASGAVNQASRSLADPTLAGLRSSFGGRIDTLNQSLRSATQALTAANARADAAALTRSEAEAKTLRQRADVLAQELNSAAQRARSEGVSSARTALEQTLASGRSTQAALGDTRLPEAQALSQALASGQRALAGSDPAAMGAARLAVEAAVRAASALQARQELAARIRPLLQPLLSAYFGGDYARAAAWAGDAALKAAPSAYAHALLIRAAARYELYVQGGEMQRAELESVRADIRAARALQTGLSPSARAFSPRFRAVFDTTR